MVSCLSMREGLVVRLCCGCVLVGKGRVRVR